LHAFAAAHGLQGLQALAAAHGLQALAAAHGLHGLHAFAALHGLQGLQAAYAGTSLTTGDKTTAPAARPRTTGRTDAPERSLDLCIFIIVFSTMGFAEMAVCSISPTSNLNDGLWLLRSNSAHAFSICCERAVNQTEPDEDMFDLVGSGMPGCGSADTTSAIVPRTALDDAAVFRRAGCRPFENLPCRIK